MALGLTPQQIIEKGEYPLLSIATHWDRIQLGQVAKVQNGYAFSSKKFNREKGLPLIRIRDIQKSDTENFYDGDYDDSFIVHNNDLLVGMDGDFRISKWPGKIGLLNQRVCRLKVINKSYDESFFYYTIQPYLDAIHAETSAVTVKHLSSRTLSQIPLPLPPLPEQRAIVAKIEQLFSELEHGQAQLKKAQAQLKVYKQAVLKKAFEGNWEELNINEVTENFDGKRKPLSRKFRETFKGYYPYYGACDVIDYVKEYLFDGEYLLIGEDGANLVSKNKPLSFIAKGRFWVNNHAHVLKPNKNMNIKFLMYQFNALDISEFISGSAQPKLSQRNLNRIQLKICELQQQTQIVEEIESRFSVVEQLEKTLTAELERSQNLRQSILKQAFEGRLLNEKELAACRKEKDWKPARELVREMEIEIEKNI